MATFFKRKRNGRKAAKWSFAYYDFIGGKKARREVAGTADLAITKQIAAKMENEAALRKRGVIDARAEKMAGSERLPLEEHLMVFLAGMEGRGATGEHMDRTESFIRHAIKACGFAVGADIDAGKVSAYVADLRRGKQLSARAVNARLTAIKAFCRWLWQTERLRTNPMKDVRMIDSKGDHRRERRVLSDEEAGRLIQTAERGAVSFGMSGPDRAMLYRLALGTGFRANELRNLTPRSFDLDADPPTVTVEAGYSKRRRRDVQLIRRDLAEALRLWLAGRPAEGPVFSVPERTAEMLRADLEAAREVWLEEAASDEERRVRERTGFLAYRDSSERVADFHSLRHTYITNLVRGGAHPKVAQTLARHSTVSLTLDKYTHLGLYDEAAALETLPPIQVAGEKQALRATGTDDKAPIVEGMGAEGVQRAVQRADRPGSVRLSAPVGGKGEKEPGACDVTPSGKSRQGRQLDTPRHRKSPPVRAKKAGGPRWDRTTDQGIMSPLLCR